jgi:hypothetical protein
MQLAGLSSISIMHITIPAFSWGKVYHDNHLFVTTLQVKSAGHTHFKIVRFVQGQWKAL